MTSHSMTPTYADLVAAVRESDVKAQALVGALTEEQARESSGLPGWSRGHVVTHMSRNADALGRFVAGVHSGESGEMYPGDPTRAMPQSRKAPIARPSCWHSTTASRERGWSTHWLTCRRIGWTLRLRGANLSPHSIYRSCAGTRSRFT